ncbi:Uncharacterized protein FWK35_00019328 [Aphis craccivora]|uniref:Uncharacterized protein n=1 Tax=Aphis craccivora TaxID=307492 RepID=A0A6G0YAC6_APHCR|nr:Uncharacterized protein FWK35_00019328 [Aphis craccivora]
MSFSFNLILNLKCFADYYINNNSLFLPNIHIWAVASVLSTLTINAYELFLSRTMIYHSHSQMFNSIKVLTDFHIDIYIKLSSIYTIRLTLNDFSNK